MRGKYQNQRGHPWRSEDELPTAPVYANHYEWSKYEAERIVRAAMHAGLPVTVFRPSMVVGDTETGHTRDFNVIYPLMRLMACGYVTRFPANPAARLCISCSTSIAVRLSGYRPPMSNSSTSMRHCSGRLRPSPIRRRGLHPWVELPIRTWRDLRR